MPDSMRDGDFGRRADHVTFTHPGYAPSTRIGSGTAYAQVSVGSIRIDPVDPSGRSNLRRKMGSLTPLTNCSAGMPALRRTGCATLDSRRQCAHLDACCFTKDGVGPG